MKLSVVIVNYNVEYFLEQCLHSIRKASKNIEVEIFVVDNNSVDNSVKIVRDKFPEVRLITNKKNTGFSFANNQAMKIAKGEYILLLNPDTVVEEDTFEKILNFMDLHPEGGGLGVKMLDGKGKFLPESKRGLPTPAVAFFKIFGLSWLFPSSKRFGKYHLGYLDADEIHEVDVLSGAFMLLRKSVIDQVGLLDEAFFMYGEDIDLSYRINKGGYKNYYFPKTRIIHYKGESTKKSSVNYVFVFYQAMVIFAKKHFSNQNAALFSFLINFAIYLRAGFAILNRFLKRIFLPLVDGVILFTGLMILKDYYEHHIKFIQGGSYSESLVRIAFSAYVIIWLGAVNLNGGYKKPVNLLRILRGILTGTAVILIIYSLLNETYRFSRALILIGTAWSIVSFMLSRLVLHLSGLKGYTFNPSLKKRILIAGSYDEIKRVHGLLIQSNVQPGFIGLISINGTEKFSDGEAGNLNSGLGEKEYLGNINDLKEISEVYKIDEVIFSAKDISSAKIIDLMTALENCNVEFKIAPPESLYIIGSNSIETTGDLYVIDINSISKPDNKSRKRSLDIALSISLFLSAPVLIFFLKNPSGLIRNCFRTLIGRVTWVGYFVNEKEHEGLPKIKPGILNPVDALGSTKNIALYAGKRLNVIYAKDYKVSNDLYIVFKGFRNIGR